MKAPTFVPKLVTSLQSYDRAQFRRDEVADVIVGITLPLAIDFAIASGVTPIIRMRHVLAVLAEIGNDNLFENLDDALSRARSLTEPATPMERTGIRECPQGIANR